MGLVLGIDTGGTFTDAVICDDGMVVARAKVPTTHGDLAAGIDRVIEAVTDRWGRSPETIGFVSLSTTLATNAIVEGQGDPACLILAGLGPVLGAEDRDRIVTVAGGHDALGREQAPLDLDAVTAAVTANDDRVSAYAVASQFSVRNPAHELAMAEAIGAASARPVTCSHELSSHLDGPRRATTALLNARLIALGARLEAAVRHALRGAGITARLMVVRGDGSLVSADFAARRPIETILSGPAASVVGALHLAGAEVAGRDAVVVDIGGTTTDIVPVRSGRPAVSAIGATVAGHPTMVEAIDAATHGLGGDSEVTVGADGRLAVGPARALPLSRLAVERPEVVELLRAQRTAAGPKRGRGRLLVVVGRSDDLDERERTVLDGLRAGLGAEVDVAPRGMLGEAVRRLRRRGLIRVATMTPTDAAVVLGRVDDVKVDDGRSPLGLEAATLGAELVAAQSGADGRPIARSVRDLALAIDELVVTESADRLLAATLTADGFAPRTAADPVVVAGLAGHRGLMSLSASMAAPIVAAGASAGAYYHRVAQRLGTEAIVPTDAAVANAVGAAVGLVVVDATATITRPRAGSYVVHGSPGEPPTFGSLDDARAHAERVLIAEVIARAEAAGSAKTDLDVDVEWSERTATVDGRELLVEATMRAIATGKPSMTEF